MDTPIINSLNETPQPDRESLLKQLKDIESRIQDFEREREKILEVEIAPYKQMPVKLGIEAVTDVEGLRDQILLYFFNIYNNLPEHKKNDPASKKQLLKEIEPRVQGLCKMLERLRIEENLDVLKKEHDKVQADLAKVSISELIKQGESHTLEFKETLEYDTQQNRKSSDVLFSSLKTIAGFLNAKGGTLLIGVDDSGKIRGIEQDLSIMKHGNNDRFQQKIRNCLRDHFEPQPIGKVNVSFEKFTEGTICRVDVQASKEPVHLDGKVYVRDGNTTQLLEGRPLTDWIKQRSQTSKS